MTKTNNPDSAVTISLDRNYELRFTFKARARAERLLGKSIFQWMQELTDPQKLSMNDVLSVLQAMLTEHRPGLKEDDILDLVELAPGDGQAEKLLNILQAVTTAVSVAQFAPKKSSEIMDAMQKAASQAEKILD